MLTYMSICTLYFSIWTSSFIVMFHFSFSPHFRHIQLSRCWLSLAVFTYDLFVGQGHPCWECQSFLLPSDWAPISARQRQNGLEAEVSDAGARYDLVLQQREEPWVLRAKWWPLYVSSCLLGGWKWSWCEAVCDQSAWTEERVRRGEK